MTKFLCFQVILAHLAEAPQAVVGRKSVSADRVSYVASCFQEKTYGRYLGVVLHAPCCSFLKRYVTFAMMLGRRQGMPRQKVYPSSAARQAAHRLRRKESEASLRVRLEEIFGAAKGLCARAGLPCECEKDVLRSLHELTLKLAEGRATAEGGECRT